MRPEPTKRKCGATISRVSCSSDNYWSREHDPGRLSAGLERADLDPADDAIGAGRGRHLNAIALRAVTLDHPGQVDRV